MNKLHVEPEPTNTWCAYFDPEPGSLVGRGNTREEAVTDLLEQTDEKWSMASTENQQLKRSLSEYHSRECVNCHVPLPVEDTGCRECYDNALGHVSRLSSYAGELEKALREVLRQIDVFVDENGEANFYTGDALAVLEKVVHLSIPSSDPPLPLAGCDTGVAGAGRTLDSVNEGSTPSGSAPSDEGQPCSSMADPDAVAAYWRDDPQAEAFDRVVPKSLPGVGNDAFLKHWADAAWIAEDHGVLVPAEDLARLVNLARASTPSQENTEKT